MKKSDVEMRKGLPAVNVKVYGSTRSVKLPLGVGSCDGVPILTEPAFTHEWMESADAEWTFGAACESGWEQIQSDALDIFGKGVKVYAEGRSGGWAVVHGLPPVESWDAIDLGKWARFEKYAKGTAADVPRAMIELVYHNVYLPASENASRAASGMCE